MRLTALPAALAAVLLSGCVSQPRTLNAGSAGPWRVTMSSLTRVGVDAGERGVYAEPGMVIGGWCDHLEQEIRLPWDVTRDYVAAISMHELGHKVERDYPDIWMHLDAMDAPGFPCGSDELHAAQREARKAAAAEAKP